MLCEFCSRKLHLLIAWRDEFSLIFYIIQNGFYNFPQKIKVTIKLVFFFTESNYLSFQIIFSALNFRKMLEESTASKRI
jgi:hypothetical protein